MTLNQIKTAAFRAGLDGADWENVINRHEPDIRKLAEYNQAKQRRIRQQLLGAVLRGAAERNGGSCWFQDDDQQTVATT